jgi:xanthine dehydrogenase YagT iron-sulfur-binding subunit
VNDDDSEAIDPAELAGIDPTGGLDELLIFGSPATRRHFLKQVAGTSAAIGLGPAFIGLGTAAAAEVAGTSGAMSALTASVQLKINGVEHKLTVDPRTTLLDALREHLQLTGSKKGCDHGQCGACTVLVNGRRINSCLSLAIVHEGDEITTIEGLAKGDEFHPVQAAFLEHDGFQCGYCTPGQICSAVACIAEGHAKNDAEIREWMSGNLCRCGAYPNIVAAVKEAQGKMPTKKS